MIAMLLDVSVRVSLVAGCVALILAVSRVRSSGVRHGAWTSVLCAMLLMPVLPRLVPSITVPSRVSSAAFDALPDFVVMEPAPDRGRQQASAGSSPGAFTAAPSRVPVDAVRPLPNDWPAWPALALTIYLSATFILLCRLAIGWGLARRISRTASVARSVEAASAAPLSQSNLVATPVIVGVLRPRVILPVAWTEWPADKLQAILAHERAHMRRRDPLVAFLAHLNRCVFWFHPLAWWLERALATMAEQACDDEAVRVIGERRRYADVLLDMAEAVRRSGGRIAWQGVGVDGNGLLGQRIDRILSSEVLRSVSRARKAAIFVSCAVAIIVVVACRQSAPAAAPLQPDPTVAEQLARNKAQTDEWNAARDMTAQQVDELEAAVKKDPADLAALKKLRTFYHVSGQKVFGWNDMIARRRPHILRLIDQYPEHELASWRVSASADPGGYAEAKTHWLAQAAKPGVTAKVLTNAASFLEENDPQLAEELLLRARAADPEGRAVRYAFETDRPAYWSRRLGSFYARVIVGPRSPKDGRPLRPLDADPYARDLRVRLTSSDDAPMLGAAGTQLVQSSYFDPVRGQLGRQYLERALQLDHAQLDARRGMAWADESQRSRRMRDVLRAKEADLAGGEVARKVRAGERLSETEEEQLRAFEYEVASSLPEADRLPALADLATRAYMWAEHLGYTVKDEAGAKASYERSKKAAQDALTLALKLREHPAYSVTVYRATIALGTHALREGDRKGAVRYMLEAVNVPASEQFAVGGGAVDSLAGRLDYHLLKAGERASVAEFFERSATLRLAEKDRLLKDAAAIRAGVMPLSYQYAVARGE